MAPVMAGDSGMLSIMPGDSAVASMMWRGSGMAAMLWRGSGLGNTGVESTECTGLATIKAGSAGDCDGPSSVANKFKDPNTDIY